MCGGPEQLIWYSSIRYVIQTAIFGVVGGGGKGGVLRHFPALFGVNRYRELDIRENTSTHT